MTWNHVQGWLNASGSRLIAYALFVLSLSLLGCGENGVSNSVSSVCPQGNGVVSGKLITYPTVSVGDPGNSNDANQFGAVSYKFNMGKFNVTIAQYAAFLNAVAKADVYELYHPRMGEDMNVAGIQRSGKPGSYLYTVLNNGGDSSNRPIAYVTWFDAARFANWMANGQPEGLQEASTTEDGAYSLRGILSGSAVGKNVCNPNTGQTITFWIPTENEWYKAAYYTNNYESTSKPGYYLYATQSNTAPGNIVGSSPNQMNVIVGVNFSVTQNATLYATQNYLTDVGAYTGSPSYYGTFDQNGGLYQWNDLDGKPFPYRGVRGSFWFAGAQAAQSINFAAVTPEHAGNDIGFRLSSISK